MIKSFKDLDIYRESYELAVIINRNVNKLPIFEKNDLGFQLRKTSKSVPSNIAEGWAKRRFSKEFKHHLDISVGSCNEMEVHINIAMDLNYWKKEFCEQLLKRYIYLGGKIVKLRENWKTF